MRVLAEVTLITVVGLVFGRVFAPRNPALRHGVCVCALMCVLVAPLTTYGLQKAGWSTFQISLESEHAPQISKPSASGVPISRPARTNVQFWTLERARSTASLALLVWIAGTCGLMIRLMNGTRKVSRLRRSTCSVDHPNLRTAMDRLQREEGLPIVPVRFARRLHCPIVVGPWRTTVILPEKLLEQLDEDQLRCVLAHELTHVRQRDPLVGLIQRVVEASYWPHPLVHFLNRDLVRAREEVCDNVALHGTTAPHYADTLLTVALGITTKAPAPGLIGLMTPPWRLEERVKGLLDPQRRLNTTMNIRHLAAVAIALATGTTLIGGARIVAAPNPRQQQDTVELSTHYNSKTKSVYVTAKTTKKKVAKPVRVMLNLSKAAAPKTSTIWTYPANPTYIQDSRRVVQSPVIVKNLAGKVYAVQLDPRQEPSKTTTITATQSANGKSDPTSVTVSTNVSTTTTVDPIKPNQVQLSDVQISSADDFKSDFKINQVVQPKVEMSYELKQIVADDAATLKLEGRPVQVKDLNFVQSSPGQVYFVDSAAQSSNDKVRFRLMSPDQNSKDRDSYTITSPEALEKRLSYTVNDAFMSKAQGLTLDSGRVRSHPTTVYIQGDKIRIVGDDVHVVYLDSKAKNVKLSVKSNKLSVKSKDTKPKSNN